MLDADGQPDQILRHPGAGQLLGIQLAVRGTRRMAGQGLGIADVDQAHHQQSASMNRAPASMPPSMPKQRIEAGVPPM